MMFNDAEHLSLINLNRPDNWNLCFIKLFYFNSQAFLANDDLGDSLDSVEALIKKHEDFEKSLAAQEEKIKVHLYFDLICLR